MTYCSLNKSKIKKISCSIWTSSGVDCGGREGFPYDRLADVGGDEQGDARAQPVALLQQLVEDNYNHARGEQLQAEE